MANASEFPYTITISIPFPTHHLASTALRALRVDQELSPLVRRSFTLTAPSTTASTTSIGTSQATQANGSTDAPAPFGSKDESDGLDDEGSTVLTTVYRATTNRMLRVSVNGFFESVGVVLQVMEELDVDVLEETLAAAQAADSGIVWK